VFGPEKRSNSGRAPPFRLTLQEKPGHERNIPSTKRYVKQQPQSLSHEIPVSIASESKYTWVERFTVHGSRLKCPKWLLTSRRYADRYTGYSPSHNCPPLRHSGGSRNPVNSTGSGCPRLTKCRGRLIKACPGLDPGSGMTKRQKYYEPINMSHPMG